MSTSTNQCMAGLEPISVWRAQLRNHSLGELLLAAQAEAHLWFAMFEDSSLTVAGAAELREVVWLIQNAPNDRLAGLVEGLWLNN